MHTTRARSGPPFPGVVVIHHMPGWDEWTNEVVRKFAHHGYAAIAPHLYSRLGPGPPGRRRRRRRAPRAACPTTRSMGDVAGGDRPSCAPSRTPTARSA